MTTGFSYFIAGGGAGTITPRITPKQKDRDSSRSFCVFKLNIGRLVALVVIDLILILL